MQIKKETVISVLTTSGETINAGDTVIFNFDDKCCVGVYLGLSDRGALKFKGKIADTDVTFHVMPRSIKEIYKADVKPDNGVREVKRKAKVGEYIKIVDAHPYLIPYKNGDVFKVISTSEPGVVIEKDGTPVTSAWHREYVVLENYKPEEKKEDDSEIHVGDMIEVTRSGDCYSTYDTWSGLGSYRQNFVNGVFVEDGMVAKVLNIAKHDRLHNFRLALIQNPKTSQVFIINIDGIKKVER